MHAQVLLLLFLSISYTLAFMQSAGTAQSAAATRLSAAASPVESFLSNLGFKASAATAKKEFIVAITGASGLVGTSLSEVAQTDA
jgi:hypothetical protein